MTHFSMLPYFTTGGTERSAWGERVSHSSSAEEDIYACTTSRCSVHITMVLAIRCYNPRTARSSNSLAPAVGTVDRGSAEGRKDDA